ncbi:MAG: hypothetical protein HC882_08880 [Acidobacteria bacterium]|nr:hypothetical protein [Acidobacteriota bacterium]
MSTGRRRVALFYALTFILLAAVPILHGFLAGGQMDYGLIFVLMVGGLVAVSVLRSLLPGPEYARSENFMGAGLIGAVLAADGVFGTRDDAGRIHEACAVPLPPATKALPFALLAIGILFVAGKSLGLGRGRGT